MSESATPASVPMTFPDRFAGKVALVTGGASGIGRATVQRFVAEGARVVVGDLADDALAAVSDEFGEAVRTQRCDVTYGDDVAALVALARTEFGGLDVVCANAGTGGFGLITDMDLDEWNRVVDVNLTGPFLTIKHAARAMNDGGAIVITASLNAVQPAAGMSPYCASKAGVAMLARVAAMELGPRRIRVNAIAPGLVSTGLTAPLMSIDAVRDGYVENTPVGRYADPREIAGLIGYLASDEASFVSGALHLIDGGANTMRYPDLVGALNSLEV